MTISELKRTVDFVNKHVAEASLPQLFQNLMATLQANSRTSQTNQQPQAITKQKAELLAAIKAIQINKLTLNERRLLNTYIDLDNLGEKGADKINHIFTDHSLDPMGAINELGKMSGDYSNLIQLASEALKALKPFHLTIVEDEIGDGRAVLQITFKEKVSIGTVTQWRENTDDWWQIIRSVGLLTDTTTDEAKVLSFQEGSVIVEIGAIYGVVKTVGLIADKSLNVIERLLELKKKTLEIKQLKLSNKNIEQELAQEAANFAETQKKRIGEEVIAEINKVKQENGEVVNAINMAVDKLFTFLEAGGTVDCRLKHSENPPPESEQLREAYSKIRKLETRVEALKQIAYEDFVKDVTDV